MGIWKQTEVVLIVFLSQSYSWCISRNAHPAKTVRNVAI